jgi:stage II sporulation protein D
MAAAPAPSHPHRLRAALAAIVAAACLGLPGPAQAKEPRWVVSGQGYGHGVGMSQFGARGMAKAGVAYPRILRHYYPGTKLGEVPSQVVRVLLAAGIPDATFSGARSACALPLNPNRTYVATVQEGGGGVALKNDKGHTLTKCPWLAASGGAFNLAGKGSYRGTLELRPTAAGALDAVNSVQLEQYLRGVVASELPSGWPEQTLRAQAVAARSYAISKAEGGAFDHYDDTRSQVYGGIAAEMPETNQAVAATAGEVVLHQGQVAETYFFSTSGGHTEDNENSFLGGVPLPYLRGVPDPYDAGPHHSWKLSLSQSEMEAELGDLVKGELRRIVVTERGASPRIVEVAIVGTGGTSEADGPTLKARLGLKDTWAYFKKIGRGGKPKPGATRFDTWVPS